MVVKYPWILVLLTIALIIVFVAYVFHEVLETLFG